MDWKNDIWPSSSENGVYFAFGYDPNQEDSIALYMGKASMTSYIGARLQSHFSPYSNREKFKHFHMGYNDKYIIELIGSIAIKEYSFLVPSLEEFLIGKMAGLNLELGFELINKTGKG